MDERSGETRVERSEEIGGGEKRYYCFTTNYGFVPGEPWGITEAELARCIRAAKRLGQIEDRGVEGLY